MRERFSTFVSLLSNPTMTIGGAVVVAAVVVGGTWYMSTRPSGGNTVSVTRGPITEEVQVTGTVKAAQSTTLAFQTPGRIAGIRVAVGDHVTQGQTLATLDGSTQAAALALAEANLEVQQAKLNSLTAGTRPQQLAIDQTAAAQAKQALASAVQTAYTDADDAVHAKADKLFTNPRNASVQLILTVPDAELVARIQAERLALEPLFVSWQTLLNGSSTPEAQAVTTEANLKTITTFLNDLTTALAETQPNSLISAASLSAYQTSVNTGRASVAGALSAVIAADTAYKNAEGALTLATAGATANDIAAQQAAVDAANASVAAAQAAAAEAVITAPISGTITAQNANVGQTVVPGVPLISMIADGAYEADTQVSDADIAKVHMGDPVNVTFASYPDVIFHAKVTTVDPAAQITNGVSSYGVTVTFVGRDPRLMPGLSANINIITATKQNVLLVPSSAVLMNGSEHFVYTKARGTFVQTPVTVGIVGANGMTEITSGLTAGEIVRTFGGTTTS